jgi:hypothetical protein
MDVKWTLSLGPGDHGRYSIDHSRKEWVEPISALVRESGP